VLVAVLGHVDHGKTSILDRIRGTGIASKEPGLITQHIGASFVPRDVIEKRCGKMLEKYNFKLTIPGLLALDTPGHAAFTNLRKRGGSVADIAILVVDVAQGIQPQTVEAIEILKQYKTPFVVAANKIDLIHGWIPKPDASFSDAFADQRDFVQAALDEKVYGLVGGLAKYGFDSERFDRINDLTKQIVIVPVSAKTGEGFPELLMFLAGLAQKFMEAQLNVDLEKPARGSILEVKEVTGLGMTLDAVIYDGKIETGDEIAFATMNGARTAKVRALLLPAPLEEIRDPSKKFKSVDKVYAAAGLKIAAPGLEGALAGSQLIVVEDEAAAKKEIEEELEKLRIERETLGVIVKTDALGSLEAVVSLLTQAGIPIRRADVGNINKKDLLEAESVKAQNRYFGAVFSFNMKVPDDIAAEAADKNIKIFSANVIYRLDEEYKEWAGKEKELEKKEKLAKFTYPAKLRIMPGCVFRISKPAVVGVEVLAGTIRSKCTLMNADGKEIGTIASIQEKNKTLDKAEKGAQVAIAIEGVTVGRQINEKEILFTSPSLSEIEALEKGFEDKELLAEIKAIKEKVRE
jgi:translation initiation factor 5B